MSTKLKSNNDKKKSGNVAFCELETMVSESDSLALSPLSSIPGITCAVCDAFRITEGGTADLKLCSMCNLVYYCSRECQVQDWPQHRSLCKGRQDETEFTNIDVLSIPPMMKQGCRVLINERGKMLTTVANGIEISPQLFTAQLAVSIVRVKVSSADKSFSLNINALYSSTAPVSIVSENLADRLGLVKSGKIKVADFHGFSSVAHLPSRHVDVECIDGVNIAPYFIRLALLILPNSSNDLVLGKDWLEHLVRRSGRHVVLDFAPDTGRFRFLPEHRDAVDEQDLRTVAQADFEHGSYVAVPWGHPDAVPYDLAHSKNKNNRTQLVRPDATGRYLLNAIRMAF